MKNLTVFFLAFFFLAFFNSAQGQQGSQNPVGGLSYAPDSNYVIYSQFYKGRNGVALWVHKDSLVWPGVNSGNVFYISTNGDNTTGRKGYMDLPFTPTVQYDSFENKTAYWYYPGTYSIGPGQEYNYNFSNTGTPPPYWLYAPNSKINVVENGSQDYVFKVTSTRQTDTTTYINIGELSLYDISFLRNSEALNDGRKMYVNGKIRTIQFINPDSGGDAFYVGANSTWEIDSISGSGQIAYCEPRDGDKNIFNINSIHIDQTPYPAKKTNAFVSSTLWNTRAINPYFELNVGRFYCKNCPPVFYNFDGGIISTGAKDIINIENLILIDTVQRVDTIPSATIPTPSNSLNQIAGFYWGFFANVNAGYYSELNVKELTSDKVIGLLSCSDSFNISINVESGTFSQTRAVVIQSLTSDNAKININSNFLCRKSNVISILSTDNTTDITISGRHETQQPRQPVIYAAQNIILENAELINDGVTPAIIAGTPITVFVRGDLYMNSDSIHPNVTFQKIEYGYLDPTNSKYNDTQEIINNIAALVAGGSNIYTTDGSLSGARTVTGGNNNLDFTGMGNLTATGSGSATYRFNLYPSSSLPVLLEQTSAGDTAYLQLRASLGRAILRATQDIYLEAANSIFVSTLEGTSTGIVSARPTGELIRREEAFFNAYFISDTITVTASETEINSTFLDAVSPSFNVLGDSIIYTGTDTAYFDIGYYTEAEVLESATGTYLLEISCYKNGVKVFPSESWHRVYFTASESQTVQSVTKRFTTQLVTGDVLNIRQNGTTGISTALHNFSFTGQKLQ